MKAVIQLVSGCSVTVDNNITGQIDRGFLILLGVEQGDTEKQAEKLSAKISGLRVFKDNDDKNDETVYFARMEFLKRAVKAEPKFKDVDDVTLDGLLDENYHDLFADA